VPRLDDMSIILILTLCLSLSGCESSQDDRVGRIERPVVYGEDDRVDYYDHPSEIFKRLTRESIVALIPPRRLDMSDPTNIVTTAETLGEAKDLCEGERFFDQPTAAGCSGTLIDRDLVLTAGHCIETDSECEGRLIVFNYYYVAEGVLETITSDDVYECRERVVVEDASGVDYGIIQLDRPVDPRYVPAPIRMSDTALEDGSSIIVIGFGSGVPAKIDDGGTVLDGRAHELDFFQGTVDTFHRNSGSGVFNEAGELVGVLVRGEPDYTRTAEGCNVVSVLPEVDPPGHGEDMTYVARAVEGLCASPWVSDLCGDTEGWCRSCESAADCPDSWSCEGADADPGVTTCRSPCTIPEDCRAGHSCTGTPPLCVADTEPLCHRSDLYDRTSCGRLLPAAAGCTGLDRCSEGACIPPELGDACENAILIDPVDQTFTFEMSEALRGLYEGSCGGESREKVFRVEVDGPTWMTATTSGYDTVLHVRSDCADLGSELACDDDSDPPGDHGSHIATRLSRGTHWIFLDSYDDEDLGTTAVSLTFEARMTPLSPSPRSQVSGSELLARALSSRTPRSPSSRVLFESGSVETSRRVQVSFGALR